VETDIPLDLMTYDVICWHFQFTVWLIVWCGQVTSFRF